MPAVMKAFRSRKMWLEARSTLIGGSDASSVVGLNPYKTNVELWLEKTGQYIPEDISDKPYVKYGTQAEASIRKLFALDYPEYAVDYKANNIWTNDRYPWAHASLDGWLTDTDGRFGVLEIKTTNILQSMQKERWHDRIPDNYYVQILHYMMVTEAQFAVLKARLKSTYTGELYIRERHYRIERADVEEDITYLADMEEKFYRSVVTRKKPDLMLPEI